MVSHTCTFGSPLLPRLELSEEVKGPFGLRLFEVHKTKS